MRQLLLLFIIPFLSFGQSAPKFKLSENGINPIEINLKRMSSQKIYKKTHNWIRKNYSENLRSFMDMPNEYIRIIARDTSVFSYQDYPGLPSINVKTYDILYSLNIEIKDEGCTITFSPIAFYKSNTMQETPGYKTWFQQLKKNNKGKRLFKNHKKAIYDFEKHINSLLFSLYSHLKE